MPHSHHLHCRPNTYPPRIEKSDRHYGVANGDDLTYLFPVLQVIIIVLGTGDGTKTDQFSETFTTASDPPPHFRKIMLQFFSNFYIAGSVPSFEQRRLEVLSPVDTTSLYHPCYSLIIGVIITLVFV